jgi:hypothetical protein
MTVEHIIKDCRKYQLQGARAEFWNTCTLNSAPHIPLPELFEEREATVPLPSFFSTDAGKGQQKETLELELADDDRGRWRPENDTGPRRPQRLA